MTTTSLRQGQGGFDLVEGAEGLSHHLALHGLELNIQGKDYKVVRYIINKK